MLITHNFIWNLFSHILLQRYISVTSYATEKNYRGEQNAANGTEPFQNTNSAFRNRTDDRLIKGHTGQGSLGESMLETVTLMPTDAQQQQ